MAEHGSERYHNSYGDQALRGVSTPESSAYSAEAHDLGHGTRSTELVKDLRSVHGSKVRPAWPSTSLTSLCSI